MAEPLRVEVPGEGYHRGLIACQVACPVHTDARGYVRAIAAGAFEAWTGWPAMPAAGALLGALMARMARHRGPSGYNSGPNGRL